MNSLGRKRNKEFLVEVDFKQALSVIEEALTSIPTKEPKTKERINQILSLFRHAVNNFQLVDGWKDEDDPIGIERQEFMFFTKIPVTFPNQRGAK
jgi:hypothetical protein